MQPLHDLADQPVELRTEFGHGMGDQVGIVIDSMRPRRAARERGDGRRHRIQQHDHVLRRARQRVLEQRPGQRPTRKLGQHQQAIGAGRDDPRRWNTGRRQQLVPVEDGVDPIRPQHLDVQVHRAGGHPDPRPDDRPAPGSVGDRLQQQLPGGDRARGTPAAHSAPPQAGPDRRLAPERADPDRSGRARRPPRGPHRRRSRRARRCRCGPPPGRWRPAAPHACRSASRRSRGRWPSSSVAGWRRRGPTAMRPACRPRGRLLLPASRPLRRRSAGWCRRDRTPPADRRMPWSSQGNLRAGSYLLIPGGAHRARAGPEPAATSRRASSRPRAHPRPRPGASRTRASRNLPASVG